MAPLRSRENGFASDVLRTSLKIPSPDPIHDGFVKSPDAVYHLQVTLRFIPRHCGVRQSTPHS
jgi:hypothetical protein